jgi:hypothetical protein
VWWDVQPHFDFLAASPLRTPSLLPAPGPLLSSLPLGLVVTTALAAMALLIAAIAAARAAAAPWAAVGAPAPG